MSAQEARKLLEMRGIEPSTRVSQGADWENATRQFPSVKAGEAEWIGFFDKHPEVMLSILGDIYRETKAAEAKRAGTAPTGRRPKWVNGSLDELWDMITPRYSVEPFGVAVRELMVGESLRAFAARVPMNHHTLTRMMRGELKLERWRLQAIAKAGHVKPEYFAEYREMLLLEMVSAFVKARPNASIRYVKAVNQQQQR